MIREEELYRRIARRLLPFLGLCYLVAYLDRVNVGFAKLHMLADLSLSETAYGFGAGIFFLGYFLFEVPSNLALHRFGARRWIARIMVSWGVISAAMAFTEPLSHATGLSLESVFYTLRFLLGAAEAGFFPGVLLYLNCWFPTHRQSGAIALLLLAQPLSFALGAPLSGAIMDGFADVGGLRDWQWLFLLEAAPAIGLSFVVLRWLDDGIGSAGWLTDDERDLLERRLEQDRSSKTDPPLKTLLAMPSVWLLALILFGIVSGVYGINFWLPTIVGETGLKSVLAIGAVTGACYLGGALLSVPITRRAERMADRRWPAASAALIGGAALASSTTWVESTWLTSLLLSVATAGALVATSLFWSFPGSFLRGGGAAAGLAAINSFANLGGFVGPYFLGLVSVWLQSRTAGVALLGGFMIVSGLLIALTCGRYNRACDAPPDAAR